MQEAREGRIDLSHDDENAVAAMLHFFYYGDYDQETPTPLLFHVKVYLIADKYFVGPLGSLALNKFRDAVLTTWYKDEFADAVAAIYGSTASSEDAFRKTIVAISKARAAYLFSESDVVEAFDGTVQNSKFKRVASETPEFMFEVIRAGARPQRLLPSGILANDDESDRLRLAWPPHSMMPDLEQTTPLANVEEPVERTYRCPECRATFTQTLWNGENHFHQCSATPLRVSRHYSGRQWLQYVVT